MRLDIEMAIREINSCDDGADDEGDREGWGVGTGGGGEKVWVRYILMGERSMWESRERA